MNITYTPMESHLEMKIPLRDKDKLQNPHRFMKEK